MERFRKPHQLIRLVQARSLSVAELTALFREGFSDYSVALPVGDAAFAEHLSQNDIDLACSWVALVDRPASLALIGRRGDQAWVGGMATAPAYRRRGLGTRALVEAVEAVAALGCRAVWLEVLQAAAIALYEALGFEHVRELIVWTLDPDELTRSRQTQPEFAQRWIGEHRPVREPWQRAAPPLAQIQALFVERHGEVAGAALYRDRGDARLMVQAAAVDDDDARRTLLAVPGPVRFANVDPSDPSRARSRRSADAARRVSSSCGSRYHRLGERLAERDPNLRVLPDYVSGFSRRFPAARSRLTGRVLRRWDPWADASCGVVCSGGWG